VALANGVKDRAIVFAHSGAVLVNNLAVFLLAQLME